MVSDISIPKDAVEMSGRVMYLIDHSMARTLLPAIPVEGHKYVFGHVLVIAGSRGMTGAALLASKAALRSGAGMVSTVLPHSLADAFDLAFPEGLTQGLPETREGALSKEAGDGIDAALQKKSAVVFGPGMKPGEDLEFLLERVAASSLPVVLDGGGLWALAQNPSVFAKRSAPVILTPHAGEMGRLMGVSAAEAQGDRLKIAYDAALKFQAVVVLKGAATVVADPFGALYINDTGGPALATAGSGDVLAGMIGAWIAQGLSPLDAAALSVYLHGMTADLLSGEAGPRGILAGDVAEHLPMARRYLEKRPASVQEVSTL
jgi:NAD(P)H-hydrate epimerase